MKPLYVNYKQYLVHIYIPSMLGGGGGVQFFAKGPNLLENMNSDPIPRKPAV